MAVSAAKKTAAPKVSEAKPAAKVQSAAKKTVSGSEADKDNPDESLLNAVGILLPRKGMEWSGTATELADQLTEITLPPNMITRKLNESAETLLAEYGVSYERTRTHSGRTVKLTRVTAVAAGKTRKTRGKAKKKDGEK